MLRDTPPSMRKRPRIGDLIELRTPSGLGYVQYVARDQTLGPQIRVLPGVHVIRPDLASLAAKRAVYYVHFPLEAAVHRGLVIIVGHAPLPEANEARRAEDDLFRLMEIWNDTLLAERIARGWRPV